jgi:hypothetical protein
MLDLMAANSIKGGSLPLYLHVIQRNLRDMRIAQQKTNSGFDYKTFKRLVDQEDLKEGQYVPLQQRLDTLESFMDPAQTSLNGKAPKVKAGIEWTLKVSSLYGRKLMLTSQSGWSTYNRRSLLSLCHGRSRLLTVQHLSQHIPRTEVHHGPNRRSR